MDFLKSTAQLYNCPIFFKPSKYLAPSSQCCKGEHPLPVNKNCCWTPLPELQRESSMSSLKSPELAFSGRYLTIIPHDLINYEWAAVFRRATLSPRSETHSGRETEPEEASIKPASAAELLIKYEISWKCGKTLKSKCLWVPFIRHQEFHVSVAVWRSIKREVKELVMMPQWSWRPQSMWSKKQQHTCHSDLICSQLCQYMVIGKCFFHTDFRVSHVPQRCTQITDSKVNTIPKLVNKLKKIILIQKYCFYQPLLNLKHLCTNAHMSDCLLDVYFLVNKSEWVMSACVWVLQLLNTARVSMLSHSAYVFL